MKILFITFGTNLVPSSRTRVYQYLPFFEKDLIQYKVLNNFNSLPYLLNNQLYSNELRYMNNYLKVLVAFFLKSAVMIGNGLNVVHSSMQIIRTTFLMAFYDYDILFIQKVFFPLVLIKLIKKFNKKIIFDFDDAIYTQNGYFRNKDQFNKLLPFYDLVILENDDCKKYVEENGNKKTLMITGPIDTDRYSPFSKKGTTSVTIGWIGSPATQKYIGLVAEVLTKLGKEYNNLRFKTIGSGELKIEGIQIIQKNWGLESEVEELKDFDIGIMPLPDDDWTRGKGGYKLLQYMSMGIPCCASSIGINKELISQGKSGFLINDKEDWYQKLSKLIENKELREEMGQNGRNIATDYYSFHFYYSILKKNLIEIIE